jgi:hypothetical protein
MAVFHAPSSIFKRRSGGIIARRYKNINAETALLFNCLYIIYKGLWAIEPWPETRFRK